MWHCRMAFTHARMRLSLAIAAAVLFGLRCSDLVFAQSALRVNVIPPPAADDVSTPGSETPGGGESATELAKKLQNPVGDLISVPFQNNTNFRFGPNKGTQDILNIQPVIPIHVTPEWNVITRTILPLIWNPSLQPAQTVPFGTGPTTFSAFLSP